MKISKLNMFVNRISIIGVKIREGKRTKKSSKKILTLLLLLIGNTLFSQEKIPKLNFKDKDGNKQGLWVQTFDSIKHRVVVTGEYLNNNKVGLWKYKIRYTDYEDNLEVEYLLDSNIVLFPNNLNDYGAVLITKDSSIFVMKDNIGNKIRRWCIKKDNYYLCNEYDMRNKRVNTNKRSDIIEAISFVFFDSINNFLLKYFLWENI